VTVIIQIILIVAIVVAMGYLLTRRSARTRALWTLLGIIFTIFAVVVVLFPDIANALAHLVGIGRGADLLLYCLVIVVLVALIRINLSRQEDQRRFAKAIRAIVLLRAQIERPEDAILPPTPPNHEEQ